jgi:predicted MFS family arabinose efflux permease
MGMTDRLRDRPAFVGFWTASTVSAFGTYVTTLAIQVVVVVTLDAGATGVGVVNAARWLPYLLVGILVGVVVDRYRRRGVLVGTDLGRAVLLTSIPLLAVSGHLSIGLLVAVMVGFGLLSVVHDAASQSFVPRLVPPHLLMRANARLDQSDAVAQTSGPALAGALVSLLTAPWAVLVDAVSYLASGLLLLRVRVDEPPSQPRSAAGVLGEAAEGLRWIYHHPTLRPLALSTHGWFLSSAAAGAILTPYALGVLALSPFGLGVALAVAGVGGLLGSLAAVRLGTRLGPGRVVIAARLTTAAAWGLVALGSAGWRGWVVFGLGQLVLGLSMGAENANEMSCWQAATPDRLQGRMNATRRSVNRAMIVVGAPLGGVLGDAFGFRPVLWAAACGFALTAVGLALARFDTVGLPGAPREPPA